MIRRRVPLGKFDETEADETPVEEKGNTGMLNAALKTGVETLSYNRPDVSPLFSATRRLLNEVK
jgi:hypothetical protein